MFQKSFSEMHKKRFNETSVKITTSETHNTRIKHVSNPTETSETEMKRMNRLKHGSWFAGYTCTCAFRTHKSAIRYLDGQLRGVFRVCR